MIVVSSSVGGSQAHLRFSLSCFMLVGEPRQREKCGWWRHILYPRDAGRRGEHRIILLLCPKWSRL